jgi:hypothetical protein
VRVVLAVALLLSLPLIAYLGWHAMLRSSAFHVHAIVIRGADGPLDARVRSAALAELGGGSLLALSPGALVQRLEQIPAVRRAAVDRDFPSTLRIRVVEQRPAALALAGSRRLLVAPSGRVLGVLVHGQALPRLPHLVLAASPALAPGQYVGDRGARDGLAALLARPHGFSARVLRAGADATGGVVLYLESGAQLRLGPPIDLGRKLRAAALVLARYTGAQRFTLRYVDVSSAGHPVACISGGDQTALDLARSAAASDPTASLPDVAPPAGLGCLVSASSSSTATTSSAASSGAVSTTAATTTTGSTAAGTSTDGTASSSTGTTGAATEPSTGAVTEPITTAPATSTGVAGTQSSGTAVSTGG